MLQGADGATKDDIRHLETRIDGLEGEFRTFRAEMRAEFAEFKADMRNWMMKFFVPLWIGVYGTLGAIVVSIVLGR